MIIIKNISFSYGTTPVLRDVSFNVGKGAWLGILGPNGSGKTTLLKCISRNLEPNCGNILLDGKDLCSYSRSEIAKVVGVVPQENSVPFPFTVMEMVLMGRTPYHKAFGFDSARDINIAKDAMEMTDILKFANRSIQELSGGEKQRVMIARALAQEPKVLLMDEPTSFLDIKHQQEILGIIKKLNAEKGLTVISAMHDINIALAYCKDIMFLKDGMVKNIGKAEDVVTYANLKDVFETEVYVGVNDLDGRPYYLPMGLR